MQLESVLGLPYTLVTMYALDEVNIIVCKLNLDHNVLPRGPFGKLKYQRNFHFSTVSSKLSCPSNALITNLSHGVGLSVGSINSHPP